MSSLANASLATSPSPGRTVRLPAVIGGKRVSGGRKRTFDFPSGSSIVTPELTQENAQRILSMNRNVLRDVRVDEIAAFLHEVGRNWRSKEYTRRCLYIRHLSQVVGFSAALAENEADWIALYLSSHTHMLDQLGAELGHRAILDRWIQREDCEVRAYPQGLVAHILPGNVPLSTVASIVRSLITKNAFIAKPAAGDPVTPISLVLSFLDVDAKHPVSRAASVMYWPHDSAHGKKIIGSADAVCAWGGEQAIESARHESGVLASFLPFGPKTSMALVGAGADMQRAATRLAHDVSRYDQQACFSMHQVFIERGAVDQFVAALSTQLEKYVEILPPNARELDTVGRLSLAHLEERILSQQLVASVSGSWAIAVCEPQEIAYHPLCRVVYLHPVDNLEEALDLITPDTQTVALYPMEELLWLRDAIGARGASRIVEIGLNNFFRLGGGHDGMMPLQRLVRYVATEPPASVFGKGALRTLDQHAILVGDRRVTDLLP